MNWRDKPRFFTLGENVYIDYGPYARIYLTKKELIEMGHKPGEPFVLESSTPKEIPESWLRRAVYQLVDDRVTSKAKVQEVRPGFWAVVHEGKEYTPYSKRELADKVLATFLSL